MSKQTNVDIDYEHMDDLPLTEHFEWRFFQVDIATRTRILNDPHNEFQIDLVTYH